MKAETEYIIGLENEVLRLTDLLEKEREFSKSLLDFIVSESRPIWKDKSDKWEDWYRKVELLVSSDSE